jgi:hypothetical protein
MTKLEVQYTVQSSKYILHLELCTMNYFAIWN